MVALLDDPAVAQDDDPVGVAHGREAVGDHDTGAPGHHYVEAGLDLLLGEGINAGGGLVEDEDRRVLQQHARQRDQLALAHRQTRAALADRGVEALGEDGDPVAAADLRAAAATSASVASGRP